MGCHVERITNLAGVPISTISGIDLSAIEAAAAKNDLLEFELTEELAQHLQKTDYIELASLVTEAAFCRLLIIPGTNTLLVAHLGACRM